MRLELGSHFNAWHNFFAFPLTDSRPSTVIREIVSHYRNPLSIECKLSGFRRTCVIGESTWNAGCTRAHPATRVTLSRAHNIHISYNGMAFKQ